MRLHLDEDIEEQPQIQIPSERLQAESLDIFLIICLTQDRSSEHLSIIASYPYILHLLFRMTREASKSPIILLSSCPSLPTLILTIFLLLQIHIAPREAALFNNPRQFRLRVVFLTNPSIKGSQENNRRQIEKQKNRKSAAKTKMKWFFRFRTLAL